MIHFLHCCITDVLRSKGLLRDSKNIISPYNSTIKKLTLSTYMNPLIEQLDYNFIIKNKFKLIMQTDSTVCLLVDEIRLKPFFRFLG